MKKIFAALIFVFTMMITLPSQAQDVYCGTYSSGLGAYAMSETLVMGVPGFRRFDIRIKAVDSRGDIIAYVDYHFWNDISEPVKFSNSQGYSGIVNKNTTPVEYNIWSYAQPISSRMWIEKTQN